MTEDFKLLLPTQIVPSFTNPRKNFDAARLTELADSIRQLGLQQPIIVRPLPGSRVPDTDKGVLYEIVAGERRYRACVQADIKDIPALVRDLSDDQVLEIQIIENLHRDDLSALEEAEGFGALMEHSQLTRDELAHKINKSLSYVHGRLKLLSLHTEARESLRAGEIDATRALLIARIPDQKLQIKALKEFARKNYNGDTAMGTRACQEWISRNIMIKLSEAPFDTKSAELVEAAGACTTCPNRTGASPELWSDSKSPDSCTLPSCYERKVAANGQVELDKLKVKGLTTIPTKALSSHTKLDDKVWDPRDGKQTTVAKLVTEFVDKADQKTEIKAALDEDGNAVRVISDSLAKKITSQLKETSKPKADKKAELADQKEKLQIEYEETWRRAAFEAIKAPVLAGAVQGFQVVHLRRILEGLDYGMQIDTDFYLGDEDDIDKIPAHEVGPRILLCLAAEEVESITGYDHTKHASFIHKAPILTDLVATCGLDLAEIQAPAQTAMREKVAALSAKASGKTAPAARPKEGAGGSGKKTRGGEAAKLSAQEATTGIAAAMQNLDAEPAGGAEEGEEQAA